MLPSPQLRAEGAEWVVLRPWRRAAIRALQNCGKSAGVRDEMRLRRRRPRCPPNHAGILHVVF